MNKYPFLMIPCPKEIIWGGNNLKNKYNKKAEFENIAESWEVSTFPDSPSYIGNGEYAGMTLNDYLVKTNDPFNLLIKFIDAADKLSVQVHPGDDIIDDNGKCLGKTEMWYIVDADPGAQIVYGLKDNICINDFLKLVEQSKTEDTLNYINVKKGDVYFIPSGLVHAIGKGILIAEIQQNSNTTYRIFDYNRIDKNGKTRELHVDKAIKAIKTFNPDEIKAIQYKNKYSPNTLSSCDKFYVEKLDIKNCYSLYIENKSTAVICTEGNGCIQYNNKLYSISSGQTYYLPKNIGDISIKGNLEIITATE